MVPARGLLCFLALKCVLATDWDYVVYDNASLPTSRQQLDFKLEHPKPIGLLTVGAGSPVDTRDTLTINSDLFRNDYFFDAQSHIDGERVPQRVVHPKGIAAWGYFEVTNDVSEYTSADVFNGIGKQTPVLARIAVGTPDRGGPDLDRDLKAIVLKFYTKEGILDLLNLQVPVFSSKDPINFVPLVRAFSRNAVTNLIDDTAKWDMTTLRPDGLLRYLYLLSDYGVPDGWRHMDCFPEHTYELNNKHGERWYVKFNFRTEQGLMNLTYEQIQQIQAKDNDYYIRDFYNALENKQYPSWRLEMDVLSLADLQHVNYDPFDVTIMWKKGTYKTVPVGRLTLKKNSDNQFRDAEQSRFDPSSLVPGIPGPVDAVFRARRFAYRDTQNHRISRNHAKVSVNRPYYAKSYVRDGHPPVLDNEKDSPIYYPNSFNGPVPYVDDRRPKEQLQVLTRNAVDLQEAADFYNQVLKYEGPKQRLAENIVTTLQRTTEPVRTRVLKLLSLVDRDLLDRVINGLEMALKYYKKEKILKY